MISARITPPERSAKSTAAANQRGATTSLLLPPANRKLQVQLEVVEAVGVWPTHPDLETGLLVGEQAFYEKLGLTPIAGNPEQSWLILQNGATTIGLFQGMFGKNIMTFNPGWDGNAILFDQHVPSPER